MKVTLHINQPSCKGSCGCNLLNPLNIWHSDLKWEPWKWLLSLQPPLTLQFKSAFPIRDVLLVSDGRSEGDTCHQLCHRSRWSLTKYKEHFEGFFWGSFPPFFFSKLDVPSVVKQYFPGISELSIRALLTFWESLNTRKYVLQKAAAFWRHKMEMENPETNH